MDKDRRSVLGIAATVGVAGIAGCSRSPFGGENETDSHNDGHGKIEELPRPSRGAGIEDITVTAFVDLKCPDCRDWHENVFPKLMENYFTTGDARFEHYDFPFLQELSWSAASGARGVQDNLGEDAFFDYLDEVFDNQDDLDEDTLVEIGSNMGVNKHTMEHAVVDLQYDPVLEADKDHGKQLGVDDTPAVFVNGEQIDSSYESVSNAIEENL